MRNHRRANRKTASEELALVVFDQIGGDLYEEVSDDLDAGDYEKVVDYMSQWDYGEYHDFENESDLIGYVEDMGRYVLNYTFTRAPFVALYAKAENHRANRKSRRANRKTASERMNYGDVYTVHSDGSITVHSVGDIEWVSVHVYEEDMNNDYMYDWDAIEAELYEGVASSTWGAEPVEAVPGYFISSMSGGVEVDGLADLGPGEYRLCPVSLAYWVGEGEFADLEHDDGFDYDVVIRY